MSTPMETNTEQLREILQQVYDLPEAGSGGSAEPDLVIALTAPFNYGNFVGHTTVAIESGSLEAVAEAFIAGRSPVVKIKHFYVTHGFDTSFPIVEGAVYDCSVLFYAGDVVMFFMVPPYFGAHIVMNIDDPDFLEMYVNPYDTTTIQVI